ncbi:MAG: tetratricopeptide repeat protein [Candidatus Eisenbacteria bacterium]
MVAGLTAGVITGFWLGLGPSPAMPVRAPVPDSLAPRTESWTSFAMGLQSEFDLNYKEALRHYGEAEAMGVADAELFVRKAYCLLELRDFPEAVSAAREAIERDSLSAEAHSILGTSLVGLQRFDAAIEPLARSTQLHPDVRTLNMLVNVYERLGRHSEAVAPLTRLLELSSSPTALYRRAQLLERLGRLEEAAGDHWEILQDEPSRTASVESLERILTELERGEELIRLYRLLVERFPDRPDYRWSLIQALIRDEEWDEAETELLELRDRDAADPMATLHLGLVAYRKGETQRGLSLFEEAWHLAPDTPRILRWRMRLLLAEGMLDSALVNAERLLRVQPEDVEAWRVLALGHVERDEFDAALRALHAWAGVESENADPWLLMASIHRSRRQYDEGLLAIREAVAREPRKADVLLEYASFLEEAGSLGEAESVLLPLMQPDSADARALNFVGYMLVDHGLRLPEAESMIRRALEGDPEDPAILDSMGWLWYKKGDMPRAEEWLQKAVDGGGRHPEIFEHLARVQIERARHRAAAETLRKGLALTPDAAQLQELLDSLGVR